MQGRNTFTGSSSSSRNTPQTPSPNPRSQNTFQNSFGRTTETFHFGKVQITAPFSESLKFNKLQGNPSPQSRALIHNIHSYNQHFGKPNIYGAFFYSITALNLWLNHLESQNDLFKEKANALETQLSKPREENSLSLESSQTSYLLQTSLLQEENDSLQRDKTLLTKENDVLLKHFRELKRKYDANLFAQNLSKTKVSEESSEPFQNLYFSEKLQKRCIKTIKEVFDEPIQTKIFDNKQQQELPVWIEIANIIQNIQDPCLEKHFEHGCLNKEPLTASCNPNCKYCYNICQLQINLEKFQTFKIPSSTSRFIQNFGLTFGLLLDLGFIKSFRFTGERGHNKLRNLLGDDHFLVRTTSHFITKNRPSQITQIFATSVPPAWINDNFVPAQHNFLISNDSSSWYQTMVTFPVTTKDYYNWRIHQSWKLTSKPIGFGHKLMAQNSTARYFGDFNVASKVVPYATIEVTPEEAEITDELEAIKITEEQYLHGESQNDDVDDIDWETMRD